MRVAPNKIDKQAWDYIYLQSILYCFPFTSRIIVHSLSFEFCLSLELEEIIHSNKHNYQKISHWQ